MLQSLLKHSQYSMEKPSQQIQINRTCVIFFCLGIQAIAMPNETMLTSLVIIEAHVYKKDWKFERKNKYAKQ